MPSFESPAAFLRDFGETATVNGTLSALVIFSMPGQDLLGGAIESNQYEMEYQTSSFPSLAHGDSVVVRGLTLSVLQAYPLDDGTFSRARLSS